MVYGELHDHTLGTDLEFDTLAEKHWIRVVALINQCLKIIYTTFYIKEDQVIVDLYDHIARYELSSKFAKTNTDPAYAHNPKYISDSTIEPFTDNVVKILTVFDELGREKFLNDDAEYYSVHTLTNTTLMHPYPDGENTLAITYQALHPKLILPATAPTVGLKIDQVELELPVMFHNLVALYVGSKINVMLDDQNRMGQGAFYSSKYNQELQDLLNSGSELDRHKTDTTINDEGWV